MRKLSNKALCTIVILFLATSNVKAQSLRVVLDEDFGDWTNVPVLHTDPIGDVGFSAVDFEELSVYNDENFLFARFDVGPEINLQENN